VTESPRTFDLLGTPLLATSYTELTAYAQALARRGGTHAIDLTNTHIVTLRRQDAHFRAITSRFDHFVPDGMPLIWCLNARGAQLHDRVYGPTFMRRCFEASPAPWTHYLLGGSAECVAALRVKFASAQIVGARHGYFGPDEEPEIVESIREAAPDVLFVALETPAKELFLARHRDRLQIPFVMGVGGAVDILGGVRRRAPRWLQRLGLEWAFRLAQDPRRLAGRYVVGNTRFTWLVTRELVRKRFAA